MITVNERVDAFTNNLFIAHLGLLFVQVQQTFDAHCHCCLISSRSASTGAIEYGAMHGAANSGITTLEKRC